MEELEIIGNEVRYNTILLQIIPKEFNRRYFLRPGEEILVPDLSSFQFLLEEFIACSAANIAVPVDSEIKSCIEYLHPILKKRVTFIEETPRSFKTWAALLTAVQEEFNVELTRTDYPGALALSVNKDVPEHIDVAISTLFFELRTFVMGLEYQLQINVDLEEIKRAVESVRHYAKNPETRAILASLSGILNTYQHQTVTSIDIRSTASYEHMASFTDLIEDLRYKNMSSYAHMLGVPSYVYRSKTMLKRIARELVTDSRFKEIIALGRKAIIATTDMPLPEIDVIASLFKNYLPPIISYDKMFKKAHDAWRSAEHQPIAPKGYIPDNFL